MGNWLAYVIKKNLGLAIICGVKGIYLLSKQADYLRYG
jgi:hypothetical protein